MSSIRVETVSIDGRGNRQISNRERATSLLEDRRKDIEAAIEQTSGLLARSVGKLEEPGGWQVASFEATFGVVLSAEAGAIITKASAEASIEVTISMERSPRSDGR